MTRRRCELSAIEIAELHERLDRHLDTIGLETQPRVAARILALVQDSNAQIKDYAEAIKTDPALTGKLLKLANSAFYAQRAPVTRLDRALVLMGMERTKSMSLGFYLARSASTPGYQQLSKAVWGESVYRAGLCSSLAKALCPSVAAEAFIVGLLLDCAQPLMAKLLGDSYLALKTQTPSPAKLYTAEFNQLPYTHVDVAAALVRRWRLPATLARPIIWHHVVPPATTAAAPGKGPEPAHILQRIAYYAGAVEIGAAGVGGPTKEVPLPTIASRLFEISQTDLAGVVGRAGDEYRATIDLFADHAERCPGVDELAERVQLQLLTLMEEQMSRSIQAETRAGPDEVVVGGQRIELEPGARGGVVVAFLSSDTGERIISCTVDASTDGPDKLCQRLGIEQIAPGEAEELVRAVKAMAA